MVETKTCYLLFTKASQYIIVFKEQLTESEKKGGNMNLLFSDLDGTILINRQFQDKDKQAILNFMSKESNLFIISTGRGWKEFMKKKDQYHLSYDYAILSSGGLIVDQDNQILYKAIINTSLIAHLLKELKDYFTLINQITLYATDDYFEFSILKEAYNFLLNNTSEFCSFNIEVKEESSTDTILSVLQKSHINININGRYIDITKKDIDKGTAIEALINKFNIQDYTTYSIGDSYNDMSMFLKTNFSFTFYSSPLIVKNATNHCVNSISECIEIILEVYGDNKSVQILDSKNM